MKKKKNQKHIAILTITSNSNQTVFKPRFAAHFALKNFANFRILSGLENKKGLHKPHCLTLCTCTLHLRKISIATKKKKKA